MRLLGNMNSFIRCTIFCALIASSYQDETQSVNYAPILEKMHTNFKESKSTQAVLVYESKYEEVAARFMDSDVNLKWVMLRDAQNPQSFRESLAEGIDYAVAVGTNFDPVELIIVVDDARFSSDILKMFESQWISPTLIRFYDSRDSMDTIYPCSLDLTTTYISAVIENFDVTTAEIIKIEWKYVYNVTENGECEVVYFANYDVQAQQWRELFVSSDSNEKLSVGVVEKEVFFNQPNVVDLDIVRMGIHSDGNGLEYRLLDYLGKRTNLGFVPKAVKPMAEHTTTETWPLLTKKLDEKKIDFAIARIPLNDELMEKYAYSKTYFTEYYYILSTTLSSSNYIFAVFQPLRLKVWALLLLIIFVCGPLFLTMVYFTRNPDSIFTYNSSGLMNSYFHTYRLFFGHATWNHHFCFSFNLFVLAWLCFGLMLIVGYNSTFTASISSGKSKWEIDNLADLLHGVKMGYVNLVLDKNLDGRGPFKENSIQKNSIHAKILNAAKRRNKVRYVNLHAQNLPQLLKEDDAVIADLTTGYFLLRTLKDNNFRLSQQAIGSEPYAIFARKGFRYINNFDRIIRQLYETGSFLGWYNEGMKGKNRNQFQVNTIEGAVMQLEHIYGAFVVYCIGLGLAVFALITEAIYKRCKVHED